MSTVIAANWKMYKTLSEAKSMVAELSQLFVQQPACELIIFAPFTALAATHEALSTASQLGASLGAQDVYPAAEGAFTGEISPRMLRDAGCEWVLTGHSERRHVLGECAEFVGQKTAYALSEGLSVIACVGETLQEREAGKLQPVLRAQLSAALRDVTNPDPAKLCIAYEPVWAIGTGKTATNADIAETHSLVRDILEEMYGQQGRTLRLLYGGSVKADNAGRILALDNVEGLLVGGASLHAASFAEIVRAASC